MKTTGTLFDYIAWRGDISFEQSGFNEVDNLVFSLLSYCVLKGLASDEENKNGLTLKEYYLRLMNHGGYPKELDILCKEEELGIIASSSRFGNVVIKNHVDDIDEEHEVQFSVMDFCFGNKEHYIGFRGTDDTIVGWKEDLKLTCSKVPAQDMAIDYLKEHIIPGETYYVGGHSKGGNLAIYGVANLEEETLRWVKQVYTNDAPGLCKEVLDPGILEHIDKITTRIIPTYSVIGMIFEYPFTNKRIVRSNEKGIFQHNIKSWYIEKDSLFCADKLDDEAISIDESVNIYIENTELSNRGKIIDDLFDAFDDGGKAKTVSSVRNSGLFGLQHVLLRMAEKNSPETNKAVKRLPLSFLFGKTWMKIRHLKPIDFITHNHDIPWGLVLLLTGILFAVFPFKYFPYLIGILFILATLGETVILISNLIMSRWNIKPNLPRIYLCVILLVLSVSFFVSYDTVMGFSSILFGLILLLFAFYLVSKIVDLYYKTDIFGLIIAIAEAIFLFIFGCYFIVVNDFSIEWISSVLGYFVICCGSLRILMGIIKLARQQK